VIPAVVLAAGLGTRLEPLTRLVAKPAVPVGNSTLGERVLSWLAGEGVTDLVMNLHHLPHTITGLIGDGSPLGLRVRYSWERQILGSAGGPRRALPLLGVGLEPATAAPVLIVNGDTLTDVALAPVIAAHQASDALVTMVVVRNPAPDRYNGVLAGDDGAVHAFVTKGHTMPSWHFTGIQIANASVFASLEDGVPAETVHGIYRELIAEAPGRVRVFPVDRQFHDVGTPADYLEMCRAFDGVDARGNVVWPEARVSAAADLTNCIVAGPVTVPAGVTGDRQIFVPGSVTAF
jgi:mannose-1-phosphate guanylyltransferase